VAVSVGGSLGGAYLRENPGDGLASTKHGLPHAGVLAGAIVDLSGGFYGGVELDAMAYFQLSAPRNLVLPAMSAGPKIDSSEDLPAVSVETSRPFAVRLDLVLIGKRW
jgi:hypothetical protein